MENNRTIEKYQQNDFLLDYIHHRLTDEERIAFEQHLEHDEMLQDAIEGLKAVENPTALQNIQVQLNDFLQHQTKKQNSTSPKPHFHFTVWVTLVIILMLIGMIGVYLFVLKTSLQ